MEKNAFEEQRRRVIEYLAMMGYARKEKVLEAVLRVPREVFVPEPYKNMAYEDRPLPIGYGQTISAISIVAYMVELLDPEPGMKALEVGGGSGYAAAVLAEVVAPSDMPRDEWGHVYTIEYIPELAEFARRNLKAAGYSDRVTVVVGDGSKGLPEYAPYDVILVSAAAPFIPSPLVEQLADPGRMVIPVGDFLDQYLCFVEKRDGKVRGRRDLEVLFVPLKVSPEVEPFKVQGC